MPFQTHKHGVLAVGDLHFLFYEVVPHLTIIEPFDYLRYQMQMILQLLLCNRLHIRMNVWKTLKLLLQIDPSQTQHLTMRPIRFSSRVTRGSLLLQMRKEHLLSNQTFLIAKVTPPHHTNIRYIKSLRITLRQLNHSRQVDTQPKIPLYNEKDLIGGVALRVQFVALLNVAGD